MFGDRFPDRLQHDVPRAAEQKVVREAQDPEARHSEPAVASLVVRPLCRVVVRLSVEFDDDARLEADEVDDVPPDRALAAEFQA